MNGEEGNSFWSSFSDIISAAWDPNSVQFEYSAPPATIAVTNDGFLPDFLYPQSQPSTFQLTELVVPQPSTSQLTELLVPQPSTSQSSVDVRDTQDVVADVGDGEMRSRKRRRSERIKIQSTIPARPTDTVSSNLARVSGEIKEIEMSVNREGVDEGDYDTDDDDDDEEVSPKKKKYWKERGYDELGKMHRLFSVYEKHLFHFAGEFSEFAYKVHRFWQGRAHVFDAKQKALEYLTDDVTATAVAHGKALRNMRGLLESLPFHPGSFRNGNQIISDHPTFEYSTKRIANSLDRGGEFMRMEDLIKDLKGKQKIIDAKQVCENSQVITQSITPDCDSLNSKRGDKSKGPKPMQFKQYCESFLKLVKVYFTPHHEVLSFDIMKNIVKDKVGLDTWRDILNFFSDKFKLYSILYRKGKNNVVHTPESLDAALKDHMTTFKIDFEKFLLNEFKRSKVFPAI